MYELEPMDLIHYIDHLSAALSYKIKFKHIYRCVDIRMPKFNSCRRALTKEFQYNVKTYNP